MNTNIQQKKMAQKRHQKLCVGRPFCEDRLTKQKPSGRSPATNNHRVARSAKRTAQSVLRKAQSDRKTVKKRSDRSDSQTTERKRKTSFQGFILAAGLIQRRSWPLVTLKLVR